MYWVRLTLKLKSKSKFRGEILVEQNSGGTGGCLGEETEANCKGSSRGGKNMPVFCFY